MNELLCFYVRFLVERSKGLASVLLAAEVAWMAPRSMVDMATCLFLECLVALSFYLYFMFLRKYYINYSNSDCYPKN